MYLQTSAVQGRSQILSGLVAMSYDPGQGFMQAAAAQLIASPVDSSVCCPRQELEALASNDEIISAECCLQATSTTYLQAAVAFGHAVSSQLLATLMRPLDFSTRRPSIRCLSACLLSLAQLSCLHTSVWTRFIRYVLDLDRADIPGRSLMTYQATCKDNCS